MASRPQRAGTCPGHFDSTEGADIHSGSCPKFQISVQSSWFDQETLNVTSMYLAIQTVMTLYSADQHRDGFFSR